METNNKLRETLGKVLWCLEWMFNNTDDKSVQSHLIEPMALAKTALAAPPRNCDIGTVDEQSERFDKFCHVHRSYETGCCNCPLCGEPFCEITWSQMPYEEGGAK